MQIFVKWVDGKTKTVDVESTDTIAEVKEKLKEKLDQVPDNIRLVFQGRSLEDGKTLAQCNIVNESTLMGVPFFDPIDKAVCTELRGDLQAIYDHLEDRYVVFIGVASFDNNHGKESIKRQQCPDALFTFCAKNSFGLTILLIDPGFIGAVESSSPQIYSIVQQGWDGRPVTFVNNKVRSFKSVVADHTKRDFHVVTYATAIPEYDLINSVNDRYKICKWDLRQFELRMKEKSFEDCCVISGNFFQERTNKSQYITLGNQKIAAQCGFIPNP